MALDPESQYASIHYIIYFDSHHSLYYYTRTKNMARLSNDPSASSESTVHSPNCCGQRHGPAGKRKSDELSLEPVWLEATAPGPMCAKSKRTTQVKILNPVQCTVYSIATLFYSIHVTKCFYAGLCHVIFHSFFFSIRFIHKRHGLAWLA